MVSGSQALPGRPIEGSSVSWTPAGIPFPQYWRARSRIRKPILQLEAWRSGLMTSTSAKSFSLSVTTTQSLASASGGDNGVQRATGTTFRSPLCHESCPDNARLLVEREHTAREQSGWSLWTREPSFKLIALATGRRLQHATPDLADGERRNEEVFVVLLSHPRQQRLGWFRFGDVADDVGVEKISGHRSTLRPASNGRGGMTSAPTSGERRKASRIPPFRGDLPLMQWLTTDRR